VPNSGTSSAWEGVAEIFRRRACAAQQSDLAIGRQRDRRALIGDNGAGKSTLIKVLTGVHPAHPAAASSYATVENRSRAPIRSGHAHALSIETVYQDKSLGEKAAALAQLLRRSGRQITDPLRLHQDRRAESASPQEHPAQHDRFPRRRQLGVDFPRSSNSPAVNARAFAIGPRHALQPPT